MTSPWNLAAFYRRRLHGIRAEVGRAQAKHVESGPLIERRASVFATLVQLGGALEPTMEDFTSIGAGKRHYCIESAPLELA
ncbi:hypothetical protein V494_07614 [Pseudogymnoascus sp. VKM F-4513 (FW-928)]|nr:hypothetical protein V494_07614 [Pseudogymnoascus sp. VKM F-4513 (FW-928)]